MKDKELIIRNAENLAEDLLSGGQWYDSAFEIDTHSPDRDGDPVSGEYFERRLKALISLINKNKEVQ